MSDPNYFDVAAIQEGDILGVARSGFNLYSMAIKWATKSVYSHVGMFIWDDGEWYIYEALARGFVKTKFSQYLKEKKVRLTVKRVIRGIVCPEITQAAIRRTRFFADVKHAYDWGSIVGLTCILFAKSIFRSANFKYNWLDQKNKIFCAEAVCRSYYILSPIQIYVFVGEHDVEATCATFTPKDIMKAAGVMYVTGYQNLV